MLRAVIFDFDGVIADTERLHLEGFRRALEPMSISISERDYFERYVGYDDHDGFTALLKNNGLEADEGTVARLTISKASVFSQLATKHATIFPGVEALLAECKQAPDPLPVAIASGALRSEIKLILKLGKLEGYIDAIVSADDVKEGKPHPESYLNACSLLAQQCEGLRPSDCAAFEDTPAGLRSATAAGMFTIGVTNTCPADELQADVVVGGLNELSRADIARLLERTGRQ